MDDPESGRNVWLRRRLPELLVEVVLIVFAVLLALAVDECRQDRMRVRRAAEAHETILEEVTANLAEVEKTLHEHEALLVSSDPSAQRPETRSTPSTSPIPSPS